MAGWQEDIQPIKYCYTNPRDSVWEQVEDDPRENRLTQLHLEKGH